MAENEKNPPCSPKDKSNGDISILQQRNNSDSKNVRKNSFSENYSRCVSSVTNLKKLSGKAQDTLQEMNAVLNDLGKIIPDIKGDVPDGDVAAGMDLNLKTENCIQKTNKSNILPKRVEKSNLLISYANRLNKSETEDCSKCIKYIMGKNEVNLKEPSIVSNINNFEEAREIDSKTKIFDERDTSKGMDNPNSFVSKTEGGVSCSSSVSQSENNDFIGRSKNLSRKIPHSLEKDSFSIVKRKENKNHSTDKKKMPLLEEYTKHLKTILRKKMDLFFQNECERSGDLYQILNDLVLKFFPANAGEAFIHIFLQSSENPDKYIFKEHLDGNRENSTEMIPKINSDAMNEYLSDNTPEIKNGCHEKLNSSNLNATSFKSVNNSCSDSSNDNQIQATILKCTINIFRIIKEYENQISSSNAVKNIPRDFFATSRIYNLACLVSATEIENVYTELDEKADNYFKILRKNLYRFRRNACIDENTKEQCTKYFEMFHKIQELYYLFRYESESLNVEICIFKTNAEEFNKMWENRSFQYLTENVEPFIVMRNTKMLLKNCFKCIWHLGKCLKVEFHKHAYFMIDEFRLELNE